MDRSALSPWIAAGDRGVGVEETRRRKYMDGESLLVERSFIEALVCKLRDEDVDKEEEPDGVGRCVILLVALSRLRSRAGISPSALCATVCMHILTRQYIRTGRQQD